MFFKKPKFSVGETVYWSEISEYKLDDKEFKGMIKTGSVISCDKNKTCLYWNNNIVFVNTNKLYNRLYEVKNILGITLSKEEQLAYSIAICNNERLT